CFYKKRFSAGSSLRKRTSASVFFWITISCRFAGFVKKIGRGKATGKLRRGYFLLRRFGHLEGNSNAPVTAACSGGANQRGLVRPPWHPRVRGGFGTRLQRQDRVRQVLPERAVTDARD